MIYFICSYRCKQNNILFQIITQGNPLKWIKTTIDSIVKTEVALHSSLFSSEYSYINLQDSDSLIMGPKAILEPYKARDPNIVFIEEMSPADKTFFEVPRVLHS